MSMRNGLKDERGASAILIALTMILIMGVAAVVIDGGFAFSERRQAQAAVDFGALAALHTSVGPTTAAAADAGAAEAITVVEANLPGRSLQAWAACTDPTRPAEYTVVSSLTPCVSFTSNFGRARVRLPIDTLDNSFAAVIGFGTTEVVAAAEVEQTSRTTADILPFTAGSGSSVCLFSNQAPQTVPPCDGPGSGTFGYLDIALFGNDSLDTPSTCALGTSNVRSAINIAKGSDHILVDWNPGDPIHNDHAECANRSEDVNQLVVQTGSPTAGATDGLVTGVSGSINGQPFGAEDGRLRPTSASSGSISVRGTMLDDTPLWTYLTDPSCPWSAAVAGLVDSHGEMLACLDDWTSGPIFSASLDGHQRFGAVPIFTTYPSGPGSYLIDFFAPVWIQTIYMNCNANRCHTIFSPAETSGTSVCPDPLSESPDTVNCGLNHTSGSNSVEGLTAFRLQIGMLHPDTQEFFPGRGSPREVRLLK